MAFDNDQREITQGDEDDDDDDDILTTLFFFLDELFSLVSSSLTLTDYFSLCIFIKNSPNSLELIRIS